MGSGYLGVVMVCLFFVGFLVFSSLGFRGLLQSEPCGGGPGSALDWRDEECSGGLALTLWIP